jgi:hypothetical protein
MAPFQRARVMLRRGAGLRTRSTAEHEEKMKDKKFAVTILLMAAMLLPITAVSGEKASEKSKSKAQSKAEAAPSKFSSATPSSTPSWDLTKPSSCSVEGPPPCPKCTITCPAGHHPICMPGDSSANVCQKQSTCTCK